MVFRKPFAFIIKHFKAFHVVMLLTSLFIMYNANLIRVLAKNLIGNSVYTYVGAENYANSPVFIVSLIGLAAVGLIYWLFTVRKKDLRYYTFVIAYYVFSMAGFYYLFDKVVILSQREVTMDDLNLIRDVSTMILLVSVPIIVMSLIRSIGFNIKQFNFSKDIKELEITNKDSEEFEILIGQNNYKYLRKFRKTIREIKYVVLEHLFLIILGTVSLITIAGIGFGYKYYTEHKAIGIQEITTVNGVYYVVNNSYITTRNLNGYQLKDKYKYVILNVSMKNMTEEKRVYDQNIFSLQAGRLVYKPINYFQEEFRDLGQYIQNGTEIPTDSFLTGLMLFEIPATMNVSNFTLKVFKDYRITDEDFFVNYEKFAANTYMLDETKKEETLEIGTKYDSSIYKDNKVSFGINKAYLADTYNEKYVICENENRCITKTELIKPNDVTNTTMLVLEYTGSINSDTNYYQSIKNMDNFFNAFTYVEYTVGVEKYRVNNNVLFKDINGKAFILVDRKATRASKINLVFSFRNSTIRVPIK